MKANDSRCRAKFRWLFRSDILLRCLPIPMYSIYRWKADFGHQFPKLPVLVHEPERRGDRKRGE